jgi:anti-sigma B factor antagonist
MARVISYPDATVVQMHDRPCLTDDDHERVTQVLWRAGRGQARLVVDCASVRFFSGRFLTALLSTMKRLGTRPGDILLCHLDPHLLELFRVTRLDQLFPIYPTRQLALAADWPDSRLVIETVDGAHPPSTARP